jgi:hypothetical protein
MTTQTKDFRVKNGLIVEGNSATVNGSNVLTESSSFDDLSDVSTSGKSDGNVLIYEEASDSWIPSSIEGGIINIDGGSASTVYGGVSSINGGSA